MASAQVEDALIQATEGPNPLLPPNAAVIVAVSGGPDSLCLLHALWRLRMRLGLGVVSVAHAEHGLRGASSEEDAAFVEEFCRSREIPVRIGRLHLMDRVPRHGESLQTIAREARYEFLEETAATVGADVIATAHTQDDQAETVLLNILRGTGLNGLRGIPRRRGQIVRPLLSVPRSDIELYLAEHSLTARVDATNTDPGHYLRNRIRLELLPMLECDYHPGVKKSLLRLASFADLDTDYLEAQAVDAMNEISLGANSIAEGPGPGSALALRLSALLELHPALATRVVRRAFLMVRGTADRLSEEHVRAVLALAECGGPGCVTSPAPPCTVTVRGDRLTFAWLGGPVTNRPANRPDCSP